MTAEICPLCSLPLGEARTTKVEFTPQGGEAVSRVVHYDCAHPTDPQKKNERWYALLMAVDTPGKPTP